MSHPPKILKKKNFIFFPESYYFLSNQTEHCTKIKNSKPFFEVAKKRKKSHNTLIVRERVEEEERKKRHGLKKRRIRRKMRRSITTTTTTTITTTTTLLSTIAIVYALSLLSLSLSLPPRIDR